MGWHRSRAHKSKVTIGGIIYHNPSLKQMSDALERLEQRKRIARSERLALQERDEAEGMAL